MMSLSGLRSGTLPIALYATLPLTSAITTFCIGEW